MTMAALVLYVEDNAEVAQLVKSILERASYRFAWAIDTQQARQQLQTQTPDIILLDVHLPGEDGPRLAAELQTHPHWQHIPIIYVTADIYAYGDLFTPEATVLIKPIRNKVLLKAIERHLKS